MGQNLCKAQVGDSLAPYGADYGVNHSVVFRWTDLKGSRWLDWYVWCLGGVTESQGPAETVTYSAHMP